MGPKEQDNDMLLLVAVSLFCGVIAVGASLFEATPSIAANSEELTVPARQAAEQPPVRVIVPFTPNINPGSR